MYLAQVVSYGNAWNTLVENYPQELEDIREIVRAITPSNIESAQPLRDVSYRNEPGVTRYRLDGLWSSLLQQRGWEESNAAVRGAGGRPIQMRGLGHTKNRVSVALHRHREIVNRWLYTLAPIATRNDIIEMPIGVSLLQQTEETLFGRRPLNFSILERTKEELLALAPLSHGNPFVLLGMSLESSGLDIVEIESDGDASAHQIVINRSIEFPPEYHQAGLGILSYFGTVLREKYPGNTARVRIEQEGLRVRLVIESDNGDKEIIEKALQEYELVVRGEAHPETLFDNKSRVLELKNELRIAQVRIETQKDLIAYQSDEIASLRSLFGHALTSTRAQPLSISVSPTISVSATASSSALQAIPVISELVQCLSSQAASDPDLQLRLLDLDESVGALEGKRTPEAVRDSGAMKKLKAFLDDAVTGGSKVNTFLGKVSEGIELVQKIGRQYNDVAEWCGAPQVPRVLLGKDV